MENTRVEEADSVWTGSAQSLALYLKHASDTENCFLKHELCKIQVTLGH